jgi:arylsulfatase
MSGRRATRRCDVIAVAALLLTACRPEPAPHVVHDLVALAPAADFEGHLEYIAMGTSLASGCNVAGVLMPLEPVQTHFAWLRPTAELRLRSFPGGARRLVLDLEPHPSADRVTLLVSWNGRKSGRAALTRERRPYVFDLPAAPPALDGTNRLGLRFGGAARQIPVYSGRIAARLFGIWLGAPGEESLAPERVAALGAPLSVHEGESAEVVVAPGRLRFALRLPPQAELRVSPRLVTGEGALLRVTLESQPGAEQELWRGEPGGGELVVPLRAPAGSPVRLSLHVEAASNAVRVAMSKPRVLGRAAQPPLATHSEAETARADTVRSALRGASVVLVILDAAGARHFGALGGPKQATPEFDRIAAEGVLFENAFSPAVYTFPAVSSLFTSLAPDEHGNVDPWTGHLSRAPLVVAEAVAARGIHTAAFVASPMLGPERGFDRGFAEFHPIYTSHDDPTEAEAFRPPLERFLAASVGRRFFAWLHFREPHFPYDPKPPFDTLFGSGPVPKELRSEPDLIEAIEHGRRRVPDEVDHLRRLYLGNLAYVDRELGWLRARLDTAGLLERTVLIVTADHGEAFWEHGHIGHNVQVYDEQARVPLLIRLPKAAGLAGRRVASLVDLADLAPTILDALGHWREARPAFEGLSLLSVAAGARGRSSVVTRDGAESPRYALRDERSTCILNTLDDSVELFDRAADPGETKNVAANQPLDADHCRQSVRAWVLARRLRGTAPEVEPISAQDRERLRALGYVQ